MDIAQVQALWHAATAVHGGKEKAQDAQHVDAYLGTVVPQCLRQHKDATTVLQDADHELRGTHCTTTHLQGGGQQGQDLQDLKP